MAFGILVVGMLMGFLAATTFIPADAGLFTMALSYIVAGTLTFMSVVFFAMLEGDSQDGTDND